MNMDKDLLVTYTRQELLALRQEIHLEWMQTDAHNTSARCQKQLSFIDAELKKRKSDHSYRGINRYGV